MTLEEVWSNLTILSNNGKMICSIEPRFNYFDDEDNYYDEVAKLLEGKDEV